MRMLTVLCLTMMVIAPVCAQVAGVKSVAGDCTVYAHDKISIAGIIYDGYFTVDDYCTWDASGYSEFASWVGIKESSWTESAVITVEVDGKTVWSDKVVRGEKAKRISAVMAGKRALTIRVVCSTSGEVAFAQWSFSKGKVESAKPPMNDPPIGQAGSTYTITVDPKSLQELAQKIDAVARAETATSGKVLAIADFALIPLISSKMLDRVVSQNAREDLSTAMGVARRFKLVERGQLNEAIKSLKLDQSGMIDSATAKKLGKMVSADYVLIGSISDRGNFAVINARMIDAQTGEVKYPASVEMRR